MSYSNVQRVYRAINARDLSIKSQLAYITECPSLISLVVSVDVKHHVYLHNRGSTRDASGTLKYVSRFASFQSLKQTFFLSTKKRAYLLRFTFTKITTTKHRSIRQ